MKNNITVLLTNDDGIEAMGLQALKRQFEARDGVVLWTVAPNRGQSSKSHGMSLERPVFTEQVASRTFAVDGLPVDCVYLGLYHLLDREPDVVVSGINRGANLGRDVIYSGTVAAAREAALGGIHGVAASLVSGNEYDEPAKNVCDIACRIGKSKKDAILLNLNYPGGPFDGPRLGPLGVRNYPKVVSKRVTPLNARDYFWLGGPAIEDRAVPDSDGWLIKQKIASATVLSLDQTDTKKTGDTESLLPFLKTSEGTK